MTIIRYLSMLFLPLVLAMTVPADPILPREPVPNSFAEGVTTNRLWHADPAVARAGYDALVAMRGGIPPTAFESGTPWLRNGQPVRFYETDDIWNTFLSFQPGRAITIVHTWQPWDPSKARQNMPREILAGTHDAYVIQWARDLAAWYAKLPAPRPRIIVRFAHEGDGDWAAWGIGSPNRYGATVTPEDSKRMFQRVAGLMSTHARHEGKAIVELLWSVTSAVGDWVPGRWKALYPGPVAAPLVGATMYLGKHAWPERPACQELDLLLSRLRAAGVPAETPIWLAELGVYEQAGDATYKPRRIGDVLRCVRKRPAIAGLIWFHWHATGAFAGDALDLSSSPAATDAYRDGIRVLRGLR